MVDDGRYRARVLGLAGQRRPRATAACGTLPRSPRTTLGRPPLAPTGRPSSGDGSSSTMDDDGGARVALNTLRPPRVSFAAVLTSRGSSVKEGDVTAIADLIDRGEMLTPMRSGPSTTRSSAHAHGSDGPRRSRWPLSSAGHCGAGGAVPRQGRVRGRRLVNTVVCSMGGAGCDGGGGQLAATVHWPPVNDAPSVASRAQLTAAARVSASVATRGCPRVRARRPPQATRTK